MQVSSGGNITSELDRMCQDGRRSIALQIEACCKQRCTDVTTVVYKLRGVDSSIVLPPGGKERRSSSPTPIFAGRRTSRETI